MRIFIVILLCLLLVPPILAEQSGSITLLTVGKDHEGGLASLDLEVRPGRGGIYLDSLPLTKLDTQSSTRYANQIACKYLDKDCSNYDFFYRIRADTNIVGGPSAGAAMSILTISVLSSTPLKDKIAITGTINSGGLIGPVAGIQAKAKAAEQEGFTQVLVPKWEIPINTSNQSNTSNIITEIGTLDEALEIFTDKEWNHVEGEIDLPEEYEIRMPHVAQQLCQRSVEIEAELLGREINYTDEQNFTRRAQESELKEDYYAQASLCFSKNLQERELLIKQYNSNELVTLLMRQRKELKAFEEELEARELHTLTDLQTYIIVKERLQDAHDALSLKDEHNLSAHPLAYGMERLNSAIAWSAFFGMPGRTLDLDEQHIQEACHNKIGEAEERINYVRLYTPRLIGAAKEHLDLAYTYAKDKQYAICLSEASIAKAEANIIAGVIGLKQGQLAELVRIKRAAVKKELIKQQEKKFFPLLGYSYYEYSGELLEHDPGTALTFTEYALELSDLDMYFPRKKIFHFNLDKQKIGIFLLGLGLGIVLSTLLLRKSKTKR